MSVGTVRPAMVPVARRMRAYFAPVDRATEQPVIFDPGKSGVFNLATPPSPWLDLGWIDNFQRTSGTSTDAVHAGTRGAAATQFRGPLNARVQFDFREWGKLQMALACGSEHMNVLAPDPSGSAKPSGGTAIAPVAVLPGSTATEIIVGAGAVDAFSIGDLVARRRRLPTANRLCRHRNLSSIRKRFSRGESRSRLRTPSNVQCGARSGKNSDIIVISATLVGRHTGFWRGSPASFSICRPRRRLLLPGMVSPVCGRGRFRRARLFLLPTLKPATERTVFTGRTGRNRKACFRHGTTRHFLCIGKRRRQRWRYRRLLPQLLPCRHGARLLSSIQDKTLAD